MDISVDDAEDLDDPLVVDVRSPAEFEEDHLPGAINLPVLNNDQRDRIGTMYHQDSTFRARREGAKTICENIPDIIDRIDDKASPDRPILLYCWRGGQRSRSLSTILDRIGYSVHRLKGGYKAYRQLVHDYLRNEKWNSPLVTLFGYTGTGKTKILGQLKSRDHSVLDLEGAANHRGSAFGGVGMGPQPSQKTFERKLYTQLKGSSPPIFTEGESRKIGRRIIPGPLFDRLSDGPRIWLELPMDARIRNIREDYPWPECRQELVDGIGNLKDRLGKSTVRTLRNKLKAGELDEVIGVLLEKYYDPAYSNSCPDSQHYDYCISVSETGDAVEKIDGLSREINLPSSTH